MSEQEDRKPWAPPWLIENIAEASRRSARVFTVYLGVCTLGVLTMLGTTDRQLVLGEPLRLPLIGTGLEFACFVVVLPLGMLGTFLALQVYLFRLKGLMTDFRTRYAAEQPRRLYPWLLTIAEEAEPGFTGRTQRAIAKGLVWLPLPAVMTILALWVVKRHDPALSYFLALAPVAVLLLVLHFWIRFDSPHGARLFARGWIRHHWGKLLIALIILVREAVWIGLFVPLAHSGWPRGASEPSWASALSGLRPLFVYDLGYQRLSGETAREGGTYRCDLRGKRLEGANLIAANLRRADLRDSRLTNANLQRAVLDEADLQRADLSRANLSGASLKNADASLARWDGADLRGADLTQTRLSGASFADTRLDRVNLKGADLRGARGLTAERLAHCLSLSGTVMDTSLYNALRRTHPDLLDLPRHSADSTLR